MAISTSQKSELSQVRPAADHNQSASSPLEKIVQQAKLTAKHEVELAKQDLRKEAAGLAAQMAADAVKKAATPEDQRNWVKTYIDKIGEVQ